MPSWASQDASPTSGTSADCRTFGVSPAVSLVDLARERERGPRGDEAGVSPHEFY